MSAATIAPGASLAEVATTLLLGPKAFATARATAALNGYALLRTDPADGPVRFLVERFGLAREVGSIEELEL